MLFIASPHHQEQTKSRHAHARHEGPGAPTRPLPPRTHQHASSGVGTRRALGRCGRRWRCDESPREQCPGCSPPASPPAPRSSSCTVWTSQLMHSSSPAFCSPVEKLTRLTPMASSTRKQRTHGRELPKRAVSRRALSVVVLRAAPLVPSRLAPLWLLLLLLLLLLLVLLLGSGSRRTTYMS